MRLAIGPALLLVLSGCLVEDPTTTTSPSPPPPPALECGGKTYTGATLNVTIQTGKGEIGAILHAQKSPITVCNFLRYVVEDYYDDTIWHRICSHVVQAGGQDVNGHMKPTREPIVNEANQSRLRNHQGTLGMAREAAPDTALADFYVNLKDNLYLDYDGRYAPGYAVFGNVTRGWDVVQQIAQTLTQPTPPDSNDPLAPPGCDGRPVPSQETTIRDIRIET